MKQLYAIAEFYLSLIAYYVLHMIFVIASDFVEAFNIPPLNIGIYVDKMAAIRALLMVIADLSEWAITQKAILYGDPGGEALKDAEPKKKVRRSGSIMSFLIMLICRIVYLWLIYFSDNKSLGVFITLCIEGFWFGVFQMSFFAVGPEFNALTSFGIHTMGNFIFFTQVILNHYSKKKPKINSLYRVRVHGWIVLITSLIALPIWIVFCYFYSYGDTEKFTALVEALKKTTLTNSDIGTQLATEMGNGAKSKAKELLNTEFGLDKASVTKGTEGNKVIVNAGVSGGQGTNSTDLLKVNITGGSKKFNELVGVLKKVKVTKKIETGDNNASDIAPKLKDALNKDEITTAIKALAIEIGVTDAQNVTVSESGGNVTVTITGSTPGSIQQGTGNAKVQVNSRDITIQVQGTNVTGLDTEKANAIAIAIVLALVNDDVKNQISESVTFALEGGKQPEITIQVNQAKSETQANRVAWKLGKALEKVDEVKVGSSSSSPAKLKLSLSLKDWSKEGNVKQYHVWSPFWLFIIGAFAEDFSVPGILPFAFLDPEKANLVNYLTPSFFMSGALMTVFLNDVFEVGGLTKDVHIYSYFKAWSEGDAHEWHALWLMNIPKYIAFFIAMWSVHGTYDSLRCIIQSRWRVLILTMTVVVPRAFLETAGYVGVANYAILASETNDFGGFDFIAYHDVLAMFCRFVYGKFAVGYNWTKIYKGFIDK